MNKKRWERTPSLTIVSPLVGFEITGTIMRKEFNLKSDAVTETGKVVAGDEVKLLLNI